MAKQAAPRLESWAARLRAKDTTAEAAAEEVTAHRKTELEAYREWRPEHLLAQAKEIDAALSKGQEPGRLAGIPVSVKDLYGVPGFDTFAGSPKALPKAWTEPGPVVERLLMQGALVTGKTHTVEFAYGGLGSNAHWKGPHNPWAPDRLPGGSSSGAGVSLVEGSAWAALGSDTAGSGRVPAAWTGTVGFKTSVGRWSTEGIVPLSPTLDTVAVLAPTVEDVQYVLTALDPVETEALAVPSISNLKLGVLEDRLFDDCAPGVAEAVEAALDRLSKAGASVSVVPMPEIDEALELFEAGSVAAAELYAFLHRELPDWIESLDMRVRIRLAVAEGMPVQTYLDRQALLRKLTLKVRPQFDGFDALVNPTVAIGPPKRTDVTQLEDYRAVNLLALRNTSLANTLGLCAVSLPIGFDDEALPVGLQLSRPGGEDFQLAAVARAVEGVLGPGSLP